MSRYVIVGNRGYYNFQNDWVDKLASATVFSGSEKLLFDRLPDNASHWAELARTKPIQPLRLDDYRDAPPEYNDSDEELLIDIADVLDESREFARLLVEQVKGDEMHPDFLHFMQVFFGQVAAAFEDADEFIEYNSGASIDSGRFRAFVAPSESVGYAVRLEIAPERELWNNVKK